MKVNRRPVVVRLFCVATICASSSSQVAAQRNAEGEIDLLSGLVVVPGDLPP